MNVTVQLDEGAIMPARAHDSDVGYDLRALSIDCSSQRYVIATSNYSKKEYVCYVICDTGVHVRPDPGYYIEVVPNSRLAKRGCIYGNSIGIIDPGYTGSIKVVFNILPWDNVASINVGDVIGQMIIRKKHDAEFTLVDKLPETDRGDNGYGSTETKNQVKQEKQDCNSCKYHSYLAKQYPCADCCQHDNMPYWEPRENETK